MPRRVLEGEVVSDRADRTVTVLVERRTMHPVYKKYVKKTKRYAAHDEFNQFKTGDKVEIVECRPISKTKRWTVVTGGKQATYKARERTSIEAEARPDRPSSKSKQKEPVQEKAETPPPSAAKKPAQKKNNKSAKKDT